MLNNYPPRTSLSFGTAEGKEWHLEEQLGALPELIKRKFQLTTFETGRKFGCSEKSQD